MREKERKREKEKEKEREKERGKGNRRKTIGSIQPTCQPFFSLSTNPSFFLPSAILTPTEKHKKDCEGEYKRGGKEEKEEYLH